MAIASPIPRTSRLGLRTRVAALCALLGLVVSSSLALIAVHFSDSYVHRLINEMLRVEGDYLRDRYVGDGIAPGPRGKHFRLYVSGATGAGAPPAEFTALAPGLHEVQNPHDEVHVAIYDLGTQRLYVVLDIGLESVRERRLARDLFALVLFGSALACWLGWFWAGRAIEPVRRLAQQVETLPPPARDIAVLAPEFADDEVGSLALAFDHYQARLREYVRRERAFTADASHELRTPLAVIRGAIEVLLDHGSLAAPARERVKRIQRGAEELNDLLDALLLLARGDESATNGGNATTDIDALLDDLLRERGDGLRERNLRVERTRGSPVVVDAPRKAIGIVVGNLLRAVTQFADAGVLRVHVGEGGLEVAHRTTDAAGDGAAGSPTPLPERSLGLGMIRRVCERRGWALEERADTSGGHAFSLRFALS